MLIYLTKALRCASIKLSDYTNSNPGFQIRFLDIEGNHTVGGRNPANQLRVVVYPIIYKVLCIPTGAGFLPSTVSQMFIELLPSRHTSSSDGELQGSCEEARQNTSQYDIPKIYKLSKLFSGNLSFDAGYNYTLL